MRSNEMLYSMKSLFINGITEKNKATVSKENQNGLKTLKCRYCDYQAKQKGKLIIHERNHTGEKPFECDICDARFTSKTYLKTHVLIHQAAKPHECNICGLGLNYLSQLKFHMRSHDEKMKENAKTHKCDQCDFKTNTAVYLRIHVTSKHTDERPFKCDLCPLAFVRIGSLNAHKKVHTNDKPHACHICESRYKYKSDLKVHIEKHQDQELQICEICGYTTKHRTSFRLHMNVHNGVFQCNICKKGFRTNSYLEIHMRKHENKTGKTFKCKDCLEDFKDPLLYFDHRRTHLVHKDTECDKCGKKFTIWNKFRSHRAMHKKHPEQLPFGCDKCSQKFANQKMLQKHKKSHLHPFACIHCSRTFTESSRFKAHMLLHTGDPCQHCGVIFNCNTEKLKHEREHFDSKSKIQFKCTECNKTFENGPEYAAHYMEHYNQLHFACEICDRRFKLKMGMHKHIEACHEGSGQKTLRNKKKGQLRTSSSSDEEHTSEKETDSENSEMEESDSEGECEPKKSEASEHEYHESVLSAEDNSEINQAISKNSETSLPLAVAVHNRANKNSNEIIIVWLKKLETDILALARNYASRIVLMCRNDYPSEKYNLLVLAGVQFTVKSSKVSSTHWSMYSFGCSGIAAKLKKTQFQSYDEVEAILKELNKPNDLLNMSRFSEKGVNKEMNDGLNGNLILCNYGTE